jgi:hypothetical protein
VLRYQGSFEAVVADGGGPGGPLGYVDAYGWPHAGG